MTELQQPICLVLLPEGNFGVLAAIRQAIMISGMRWVHLDSEGDYGTLVSDIAAQIPRTIESADAVIADITGNDPNIMYQLGFAHALKKPVLPIIQKDKGSIPSNLQGYLFLAYDSDNSEELVTPVVRWLKRWAGGR